MPDLSKTFDRVAASSPVLSEAEGAAWGWLHRKSSIKNRKSLCHCERSEAISLHHSLFLVPPLGILWRHSIFTTTFTFLLLLFLIASPAYAKYGGGTGEPNDPYLIFDANQMNAIGADPNDWDNHFKLMADIDLGEFTGTSFNIIGNWDNPFTGTFDGSGHKISNFTYTSTGTHNIGLFGYVADPNAEIRDLGLIDPDVDAGTESWAVGSLAGLVRNGTITNCYVESGSVSRGSSTGGLVGLSGGTLINCYATGSVSGDWYVGGLVGFNAWQSTITNCYSTGSVSGGSYVGGLVGYNELGAITNCYSTASISGNGGVGGLVGLNGRGGTISNCYSEGSVSGNYAIGGLVGYNGGYKSYDTTISNCYSSGSVSGNRLVGGLVGYNDYGTIANCFSVGSVSGTSYVGGLAGANTWGTVTDSFWDIETSGQLSSAGGGSGRTTAQMKTMSTFTDAGWDFVQVWDIREGIDYPRLLWEPELTFSGGTGTTDDPYLISTTNDLNRIGHNTRLMGAHFKLINDIDLTETDFLLIGSGVFPFGGVFDGNGYTISNFSYTSTDGDYIGLFAYVMGEVRDLGLIDPNLDAGTGDYVGSLVGDLRYGTVTNCYAEGGTASGRGSVGGLVGNNYGTITNCYSTATVSGKDCVGGLAGHNGGTITNSYSEADVSGDYCVGGLVGENYFGTINNCCATGSISGNGVVGGLVGTNLEGTIINCYATGSVSGSYCVGGLVGDNCGTINNCYAAASVWGDVYVGGLAGLNYLYGMGFLPGRISNCYSTGSVSGTTGARGLVGGSDQVGKVTYSFWDIQTSGQTTSAGGIGLPTAEMQTMSTFTDAGWDFTTPVWTIEEGFDYPRLWWELAPVLHAEPEVTLGTSNTITWEPVPGANDYYAECAEDANFTNIIYNTGWIAETSYEFTGLQLGQRYWYSVKARNSAGTETGWSNVESSLQGTLLDAVEIMLEPDTLKSKNMKSALLNKIIAVQQMIDEGLYEAALNKLQNDILQKTNGCAETGRPDKNDWIITCQEQEQIYPLIIETIEYVNGLMNQ